MKKALTQQFSHAEFIAKRYRYFISDALNYFTRESNILKYQIKEYEKDSANKKKIENQFKEVMQSGLYLIFKTLFLLILILLFIPCALFFLIWNKYKAAKEAKRQKRLYATS